MGFFICDSMSLTAWYSFSVDLLTFNNFHSSTTTDQERDVLHSLSGRASRNWSASRREMHIAQKD